MPVTRRKLAAASAPRPRVAAPLSITRHQPAIQPAQQTTDQRGMNVRAAAKYLGTSSWQIRKFNRDGFLIPFPIGNRDIFVRPALDALTEALTTTAA